MGHTVTILPSHKGFTVPRVMDSEYCVDAVVNIDEYTGGGEVLNATQFGLSSLHAIVITGFNQNAITGGYAASMIAAEVIADGKYSQGNTTFTLNCPAASATDNLGDIRLRLWGQI